MEGFILLHRKFLNWEWYDDKNIVRLFIHFLLLANHKDTKWRGQEVKRGQFITSLRSLARKTGLGLQSSRRGVECLKSTHEITVKTTHKFSIITLVNWDKYQARALNPTHKPTHKPTHAQHSANTVPTQDNNDNNEKQIKQFNILPPEAAGINEVLKIFYEINPTLNFGNITQRKSVERLIKRIGKEKALNSARAAIAVHGIPFAPTITTPLQLESRFSELIAFYKKNQNKNSILEI